MRPLPTWAELNADYPVPLTKIIDVPGPDAFTMINRSGTTFQISCPDSPPGRAAGQRLAERLREASRTAGLGTTVPEPVAAGWPAGEPRTPQEFRAGTESLRIMIGNLDSNPDFAGLYHRQCLPVDPTFPGHGGAYLRTFTDPWGHGVDALIIGVSDDEDLDTALELLEPYLIIEPGRVAIARVHQVVIADELRRRYPQLSPDHDGEGLGAEEFRAAAVQAYRTRTHRGMTPYLNHLALMYQLTGDPGFTERYLAIFTDMITETAAWQPDQWGRWGFDADFAAVGMIAGWHAIKDSPTFTAEDRRQLTAHLLAYLGNSEEQWVMHQATASHPARHNHFTFAALGLLFGATMIAGSHDPDRAERWLAMADECFGPQLTATKPTEDCDSYGWLTLAHTLRYALVRPHPAYVEDAWCRATLDRGITAMDNLGHQVPHGDASRYDGNYTELAFWAPAAWLLQDPAARSLVSRKLSSRPEPAHLGIDPIGHDYGSSAWRRDDTLFTVAPIDVRPLEPAFVESVRLPAPADGFDKLALRDGIGEADRYLLLDGVGVGGHGHVDAGAIVRLTSRNRLWLEDADYDKISANFHNTVLIFRDGETSARPPYASLRWQFHDQRAAMATVGLAGLAGCDWNRSVIMLPGLGFLVVDTITAGTAGPVETHCLWRTVGRTEQDGDRWTTIMGEERLRLITAAPAGTWRTELAAEPYRRTNWPDYRYAEPEVSVLRQVSAADLRAGESRTLVHLLADGPGEAALERSGDLVRMIIGNQSRQLDLGALAAGDGPRVITDAAPTASPTRSFPEPALPSSPEPVLPTLPEPELPTLPKPVEGQATSHPEPGWSFEHPATATLITDLAGDGTDRLLLGDATGVSCYREDQLLWRADTVAPVTALGRGGGPDGSGIIVGQADGRLAVLAPDGAPLWRQTFQPHMGHPATVRAAFSARLDPDGPPSVIIATESCHVEAFTGDGDFRWRYEVVHAASAAGPADLDGDGLDEIIAATEYWTWHAVRPDGTALFRTRGVESSGGSVVASVPNPGGAGRLAVFGGWDGHLTAYRPDGERAWDRAFGDVITAVTRTGDDLIIGTRAGFLYRVAPDGSTRWQRGVGSAVVAATVAGGTVVVATTGPVLRFGLDGTDSGHLKRPGPVLQVAPFRVDNGTGLYLRDGAGGHAWLPYLS
ncbi:PQQ-binding-like beta-propeller repeat protein [Microlunatus sp. GCM10028923]|uniref:outer membrane protein assembly factor BamB family protein n=1 Tax=Microlunatus sp. GCM10028923 TaxID=3273400 RepID=UPI003616BCC6